MKASQVIAALLAICVNGPIWYYLLYKILEAINASELMWFLYWIYVPVSIFCVLIMKLSEKIK